MEYYSTHRSIKCKTIHYGLVFFFFFFAWGFFVGFFVGLFVCLFLKKTNTTVIIYVVKKQFQKFSKQFVLLSYCIACLEEKQANAELWFFFPRFCQKFGEFLVVICFFVCPSPVSHAFHSQLGSNRRKTMVFYGYLFFQNSRLTLLSMLFSQIELFFSYLFTLLHNMMLQH